MENGAMDRKTCYSKCFKRSRAFLLTLKNSKHPTPSTMPLTSSSRTVLKSSTAKCLPVLRSQARMSTKTTKTPVSEYYSSNTVQLNQYPTHQSELVTL